MKKVVTLLMIVAMLMCTLGSALADRIVEFHGEYWVEGEGGQLLHRYTGSPIVFRGERVNPNFPRTAIKEASANTIGTIYNGQWISCLGITCTGGSNLRSEPDHSGQQVEVGWGSEGIKLDVVGGSIIGKIGGNETIFVYFSIYAADGDEYYYVARANGQQGWVAAKRILVFPDLYIEMGEY